MSRRSQKFKEKHGQTGAAFEDDADQDLIDVPREEDYSSFSTVPPSPKAALPPNDILRLFQNSFKFLFDSPNLVTFIQTVKGDLYERDYIKAFGDDDRRMAYSVRWTPARSLAYASLFSTLPPIRDIISLEDSNILAIGGGACGELVAVCSLFTQAQATRDNAYTKQLNINLVDMADWGKITNKLIGEIKKNWIYQNPESINAIFTQADVLSCTAQSLNLRELNLITLMFTTNELFAENKAGSLRLFQTFNRECKPGTLLLITESAGSYSHITVGTKKFPIQFLIDTILLGKDSKSGDWELISQSDSCWYRCASDFDYPLKLENMRFFYRLYRKKKE